MKKYVLLLLASMAVWGQVELEGTVVNSVTRAGMAGVHVYVAGHEPRPTTHTDTSGYFRLSVPRSRSFRLSVVYPGYLTSARSLRVANDQRITNLRIDLTPAAAVSGRIDDEDGFPVEHARVRLLGYRVAEGERKLQEIKYAESDDSGRYRLGNLRAGR